MDSLKNQGIPLASAEHDVTKSLTEDGQCRQLVTHFQHLLVRSRLLL